MVNPLKQFKIVLVNPLYGGNVGAVCRSMMNSGMTDLAIAELDHKLDWQDARRRAMHAADIVLEKAPRFDTLAEAVADCELVAGTSARHGLYREHAKTPRDWAPHFLARAAEGKKIALVFGTEDKGLRNDHLALCTQIIRIPSHPEYESMNLSHAIAIILYEIYVASGDFELEDERFPLAKSVERERLFEIWRTALMDIGFMKDDKADHMMLGLRRALSRGDMTSSDIAILMGVARQTSWFTNHVRKLDPSVEAPAPDDSVLPDS